MKRMLCLVLLVGTMMTVFSTAAHAAYVCEHPHAYYSGNRISYVRDELGHHKDEYEVYYCPECVSENWVRISTTFEGHVWTYEDQEHIHGMDMHVVYYKCYPCGKEHQVWHDCQWPCAIRYYGLRPAVVPY